MRNAGLSHVHLLPSFHFAGVDDEKEKWKHIGESFSVFYPWFYILLTSVIQKFLSSNICNLFYLNALIVTLFFPCNVHTGSLLHCLQLPLFVKPRTISLYYKLRVFAKPYWPCRYSDHISDFLLQCWSVQVMSLILFLSLCFLV